MDFIKLANIAMVAARSAGNIIRDRMGTEISFETKDNAYSHASQVLTAVDLAAEKIILKYLNPTLDVYNLALLSEETKDDGSRFQKPFFWCIDPLDGTLPFIQYQSGFSVSIALVAQDGTPFIGIVFDPSTGTMYHAIKGKGAFKNGFPWQANTTNKHLTYVTDKKLVDTPNKERIATILERVELSLGVDGIAELSGAGAVLNAIHVIENGPACMIKMPKKSLGGGSIWDYAATACIFEELGLSARSFEGYKLDLNKQDGTFMNLQGIFFSNL